jgi:hypothetical protein
MPKDKLKVFGLSLTKLPILMREQINQGVRVDKARLDFFANATK